MAEPTIPSPTDDDCEDVHWALTTACSLQARGEAAEALRWLRRAVDAAMAAARDARATELGRVAADLQEALVGARTQPGGAVADATRTLASGVAPPTGSPQSLTALSAIALPADGLDEPTHVDSRPPAALRGVVRAGADGSALTEAALSTPVGDDITLVPGTKKAAGVGGAVDRTRRSALTPRGDTSTLPAYCIGAPIEEEAGEVTTSMQRPPNMDELIDAAEREHGTGSATHPATTIVDPSRVALLEATDGGAPRVILLAPGVAAPPGAAVATLLPASRDDARRASSLLRHGKAGDTER